MESRSALTVLLVLCGLLGFPIIEINAEKHDEIVVDCPNGMELIPETGMPHFCYGLFVPSEGPMNYTESMEFCNQHDSLVVAFGGKASVFG